MDEVKRMAIYCRVSTEDQAENGYSLEDQKRKGQLQAEMKDWIALEPYVDEGISGTLRDRPALACLLNDVRAGKIDVVVITKMDRLARNLKLLLDLWDEIESYDCSIVVINESIDTSTSVGRLVRNVLGSIAEFERDTIADRTKAGREARARGGDVWRSPLTAPYGFRYIPKADRPAYDEAVKRGEELPHENGWAQIPHEAATVRRIFDSCAQGTSMSKVAQLLNKDDVPTRTGKGPWTTPTIAAILRNPAMWGKAAYGRTKTVKRRNGGGEITKTIRQEKSKFIHGCNPAIVSEELADAAQRIVSSNKSLSKRNSKHQYLLSSSIHQPLLLCGQCLREGKRHIMNGTARAKKDTHKPYRAYRCTHTNRDGARRCHMIPAESVENAVLEALFNVVKNPDYVLAEVQALSNASSEQATDLNKTIVGIDAKVAQVANKRNALMEYIGVWSKERVVDMDAQLAKEEQGLRKQVEDLRAQCDAAQSNNLPVNNVKAACALIAQGLENATFDERQVIVRLLVDHVTAYKDLYIIEGVLPQVGSDQNAANDNWASCTVPMIQNSATVSTIP
jgi:site-specific DNA recombinase